MQNAYERKRPGYFKGDHPEMFKRMILAVMMTLVLTSAANVSFAELPLPECFPCPDGK